MKRAIRPILERLVARIAAVPDVYDELTTAPTHKEAYPHDRAVEVIRKQSGSHFDQVIVGAFVRREQDLARIATSLAGPAGAAIELQPEDG